MSVKNPFMIADQEAAEAAYDAGQWALGARRWRELAARSDGANGAAALYQAACCHARDGRPDDAFVALHDALAADVVAIDRLTTDPDLATLRDDGRWTALMTHAQTRFDEWEQKLGAPALRRELLALMHEDQAARAAWLADPDSLRAADMLAAVDAKTTARMRQVVATHGWPGWRLVGRDGARAAWLLVQHADRDVEFQAGCLARLTDAVARGDAAAADAAYLHDRLAVARGEPQRYGTQFDAQLRPQPIEDEARIDERRRSVGLGSLLEYTRHMHRQYRKA